MPIFQSDAFRKGGRYRAYNDGQFTLSASIRIPIGKTLLVGDVLQFFKVGPGMDILSLNLSLSTGIFDGAAGAVDLGTDASAANFAAGSTAFQSNGRQLNLARSGQTTNFAAVFNPSVPDFSVINAPRTSSQIASSSRVTAPTGTRTIQAAIVTSAGTQTTAATTNRILTLTAVLAPLNINTFTQIPYKYVDRRDNTTLSSGGLVS